MRSKLIATALLLALAAPLAAGAQPERSKPRIAVLYSAASIAGISGSNPKNDTMRAFLEGVRELGWRAEPQAFVDDASRGITGPLADIKQKRVNALLVHGGPALAYSREIIDFAATHRLPAMYALNDFAKAGGLLSYDASYQDLFRRSAGYVSKILKGTKPADLPIQQPTKFELVINLKTAKALGLTIPQALQLRADQVIE